MLNQQISSVPLTAHRRETLSIKHLERILEVEGPQPRLVASSGEEILLPESVYNALRQVIHAMASGQSIAIIPHEREMTTQEAADFLNVSRPYLIKLLEQGEIPYIKVGSHRRICSNDILAYKQQRSVQQHKKLGEFTAFLQDEGFYDEESSDLAP